MKTINIKFLSILFFIGLVVTSCVKDDDFNTPEISFEEPNIDVNFSIEQAKNAYGGFEPVLIEGEEGEGALYLEGYVVSNDEAGNFFKTLVIQDSPENPTAGIAISTEDTDLYTFYEPGRKIYFRVDGLYSGEFAGLPTLGVLSGDEVGRISVLEFRERIVRSTVSQEIVPQVRTINQLSNDDLNTLVVLENVQISDEHLGESYANVNNTFSENRIIINCERTEDIILRNSGFATFKNELMPEGSGTLTAVFSVFNTDNQLFIRDTDDVNFDQERCLEDDVNFEEVFLNLPFSQDFESLTTGAGVNVSIQGWRNVNINEGETRYQAREFDDNKYAQISAFNSDENNLEAWLVTPALILEGTQNPTLTFDTKDGFNNGDGLKVFISTDLTEDTVENATWTELNATIANGAPSNEYAENFTPSGTINLSEYIGQTVHIGFQYIGSDTGVTTTYQIDNINVVD